MKYVGLVIILIFIVATRFASANAPAPPPIKGFGVELENNYENYVFYFAEYFSFSKSLDANQDSNKPFEYFEIEQINITKEKPFVIESPQNFSIKTLKEKIPQDEKLYYPKKVNYLIAVEKVVNGSLKSDLQQKVLTLIKQKSNEKGIYYAIIPYFGVKCSDLQTCLGTYTNVVRVESLDQNGLKFKGFDQDGYLIGKAPESPKETKTKSCFGLFLSVIVTFAFILFSRKRKRCE